MKRRIIMMKCSSKPFSILLTILMSLAGFSSLNAQNVHLDTATNKHSMMDIQNYEIMWKKSLWFRMNLHEKVNQGFFAQGHETPKILIEAVKNDMIMPFEDDNLDKRISKAEFLERLKVPQTVAEEDDMDDDFDMGGWGEPEAEKKKPTSPFENTPGDEYYPEQFYLMEVKVDRVFDKRRSKMYNDVVAISIVLPATENPHGVNKVIATFSYKELNEKVFHFTQGDQLIQNPEAVWYNSQNQAQHLNLNDAFTMGLYQGRLVKYENPQDNTIIDLYGETQDAMYKSLDAVYKLMEYEALLWSN